jgi:hypothetical protein
MLLLVVTLLFSGSQHITLLAARKIAKEAEKRDFFICS